MSTKAEQVYEAVNRVQREQGTTRNEAFEIVAGKMEGMKLPAVRANYYRQARNLGVSLEGRGRKRKKQPTVKTVGVPATATVTGMSSPMTWSVPASSTSASNGDDGDVSVDMLIETMKQHFADLQKKLREQEAKLKAVTKAIQ